LGSGGQPDGSNWRRVEAVATEMLPERTIGDGQWAMGAAGARNESD